MKQRKCKECKEYFTPHPSMFCPPTCEKMKCRQDYAMKHLSNKVKEKKTQARRELRAFNESDKTVLKQLAQMLVNKYARLRDYLENGLRCVTCNSITGKRDGGHFLPTSGYSSIRYNTNQIHQQCVNCNQYNGGRYKEYRVFMIDKYSLEYVENLEAQKGVIRGYSVEYYQRLIKVVRKKINKLELKLKDIN